MKTYDLYYTPKATCFALIALYVISTFENIYICTCMKEKRSLMFVQVTHQRKGCKTPGPGVSGGYEPPVLGVRIGTQVIPKKNMC